MCRNCVCKVSVRLKHSVQVHVRQRLLPVGETAVLGTVENRGSAAFNEEHGEEMLHQLDEVIVPTQHTQVYQGLLSFRWD